MACCWKPGVEIEPLKEQDMYEMIEQGLGGGMRQVSHKEVKANNKHMKEKFDETKPSNFITYLDANNLYGLATLPIGEIKSNGQRSFQLLGRTVISICF